MTTRAWLLVRVAALAILVLGVVTMHHVAHSGSDGMHDGHVAVSDADGGGAGYQDGSGHFAAEGLSEAGIRDAGLVGVHDVLSLCLAVLVLLFGWRIGPKLAGGPARPVGRATVPNRDRVIPTRWGRSLLISLCVLRT